MTVLKLWELMLTPAAIDVNVKDRDGYTPIASLVGHSEVVKVLLAHPNINVNLKISGGQTSFSLGSEFLLVA